VVSAAFLLESATQIRSGTRLRVTLGAHTKSLPGSRVSLWADRCRFCVDINSATLLKRGVAAGKVEALAAWQQSDQFSESERVALEYAEAVTLCSGAIEERLMERLKEHFEDDAIIELTALIAFQNLSSKFNSALGVPPQGFCRIPLREA